MGGRVVMVVCFRLPKYKGLQTYRRKVRFSPVFSIITVRIFHPNKFGSPDIADNLVKMIQKYPADNHNSSATHTSLTIEMYLKSLKLILISYP
jgi:hypothetical protein